MRLVLSILIVYIFQQGISQVNPLPCFSPKSSYGLGIDHNSICSGDFDGDGILDIATSNLSGGDISILKGVGGGTFSAPVNYTVGINPHELCTSDFNNDDYLDLAVVNYGTNDISILLGTGLASFTPAYTYSVGAMPTSIKSEDIDSDGYKDIIVSSGGANSIFVFKGLGNGMFQSFLTYSVGSFPMSLCLSDFNNDGNIDIATCNKNANNVSILLGGGTGTFTLLPATFSVGVQPRYICADDFNADGKQDIVVANYGGNSLTVLLGFGTGYFSSPIYISTGQGPSSICTGDFNFDGNKDIVVANYSSNNVWVILGDGNGIFTLGSMYSSGTWPMSLIQSDFNSDGKPDIGVSNGNNSHLSILLNRLPLLNVVSTATSICAVNTVTISASGATTVQWNGIVGASSIIVTPSTTTSYTVVGTNSLGCSSANVVKQIVVNPLPIISCNNGTVCLGNSYTFYPTGAQSYTYSNGGSVITPSTSLVYTITGTSNAGCVNSKTVAVTVNNIPLPIITATSSSSIICGPPYQGVAILSAAGAFSYTWAGVSIGSTIAVTPSVTTVYTVTGSDLAGCIGEAFITQYVDNCTVLDRMVDVENNFSVFPNPASDFFNVFISPGFKGHYKIINLLGEIIKEGIMTESDFKVDIEAFEVGVYYIVINGLKHKKIVKK